MADYITVSGVRFLQCAHEYLSRLAEDGWQTVARYEPTPACNASQHNCLLTPLHAILVQVVAVLLAGAFAPAQWVQAHRPTGGRHDGMRVWSALLSIAPKGGGKAAPPASQRDA